MIFINNLTCYSIFILDLKKKDLPNISHIFKQRLKVQLQQDKIVLTSSEFDKIFEPVDMKFFKTNNDRKIIGTMSDLIYQFKGIRADNYTHIDSMDINYVNSNLNNIPYNNPVEAKKILSFPKENMKSAIAQQWRAWCVDLGHLISKAPPASRDGGMNLQDSPKVDDVSKYCSIENPPS